MHIIYIYIYIYLSIYRTSVTYRKSKWKQYRGCLRQPLKTHGAAAPCTRITWASFLGLEEPSLKLLQSAKLQSTNSSPISNCRCSKSAIFFSCNINYSINLLLWTSVTYRKSKWKQYRGLPQFLLRIITRSFERAFHVYLYILALIKSICSISMS